MKLTASMPLGPLGLAFLLCACPGKTGETNDDGWVDTSDTQDTSDTADTQTPTGEFTEEEVQLAVSSAEMPNLIFLMSSLLAAYGDETSCPSVLQDEATQTTTVTGGCTTEDGTTFSGEARFVYTETALTMTYTKFGWMDRSAHIEMNAVARMDESETIFTTGTITIENPEQGSHLDVQYTDHTLSSAEEYVGSLFEQNGNYTVGGQMVISNLDSFEIDLTAGNNETCELEMDTYELKLTGTRGEIEATSNPSDCDKCLDWSTANASGQFCTEDETDTGAN